MKRHGFRNRLLTIPFLFFPLWAAGASDQKPGTPRMIALLAKVAAEADPRQNQFLNDRRAELARAGLSNAQSFQERLRARQGLGDGLRRSGRAERAREQGARALADARRPRAGAGTRGVHRQACTPPRARS